MQNGHYRCRLCHNMALESGAVKIAFGSFEQGMSVIIPVVLIF